jgi:hypothetical protein
MEIETKTLKNVLLISGICLHFKSLYRRKELIFIFIFTVCQIRETAQS